jgi:uncharacterized membrane protein
LESTLPLITNDAVVLGILMGILAAIFTTSRSNHPFWKKLYTFVPPLLLCYFLPSVVSTLGVISGEHSQLYFVSSRYLLPTSLVLLTLSVDFGGIVRLGPKAGIMFLVGTLGILLGGPIAILVVSAVDPEVVGGQGADAVWRGMATVAGSWIGGGANQTAMKEIFEVGDDIFSAMIAVDILLEGVWLAVLLYAATRARSIDAWTGADTRAIEELRLRVESYQAEQARIPGLTDTMQVLGVGFSVTAIAHLAAGQIAPWIEREAPGLRVYNLTSSFFWIIIIATTISLILSKSALLYVLIASIGMRMNILAVTESPGLFAVGALWILFHAALLILVARIIRAPVFFVAVGSQANIGGAASAPVVASAFHPSLAPVGVLLAVVGYGVGTYAAYLCALLMRAVSPD